MKKFILILALILSAPVSAFNEGKLTCMYSRWCRKNVYLIKNIDNIKAEFPNNNYDNIADEFNELVNNLKRFKVKIFLGDEKYFPKKYIGVYNTKNNNIYLNKKYMNNDIQLLRTLRHEAWHVAQDCKAGLRNRQLNMIIVPKFVPKSFVNYEVGAKKASRNKGMTQAALESCYTNDDKYIESYIETK